MRTAFRILAYILIGLMAWIFIFVKTNDVKNQEDFAYKAKQRILGPCSVPLKYSIGQVDPGFGISQEDFLKEVEKAEDIWEVSAGRDLFEYDPEAEFRINLIFDERQERTLELRKLEGKLDDVEETQAGIQSSYKKLVAEYDSKLKKYDDEANDYNDAVKDYQKEVEYWNSQGGAPKDEYDKLKKESERLDDWRKDLEKMRDDINDLVSKINQLSGKEKKLIEGYNQQVETYKDRFGEAREFDQGLYTGEAINIYQFNENPDLELVLSHELGHYLGIEHLSDPRSIMYYLIGEQDLENIAPTEEDLSAVGEICK